MNDLSLEYLREKLETFIEAGQKAHPGGEPGEFRFYIEVPSHSWEMLSHGMKCFIDIKRPHFTYKGELVMKGSLWQVVKMKGFKYETA